MFHLADDAEATPDFAALGAVCGEFGERTAREAGRSGDPFAVAREIAPTEVLRLVCPRGGGQRENHAVQHGHRAPAHRSAGTGKVILDSLPAHAPLRAARSGLRRVLGIEQAPEVRPVIQGTIDILTDWQLYNT